MGFHILLDDVDYVERESCTNIEFYDKMRAAKGIPSTAVSYTHLGARSWYHDQLRSR